MTKFIFVHSTVQQVGSWITISYFHSLMIHQMLLSTTPVLMTFYTMPAMKTSLGISSKLVQIAKVAVLTLSLFRQFPLKRIQR